MIVSLLVKEIDIVYGGTTENEKNILSLPNGNNTSNTTYNMTGCICSPSACDCYSHKVMDCLQNGASVSAAVLAAVGTNRGFWITVPALAIGFIVGCSSAI